MRKDRLPHLVRMRDFGFENRDIYLEAKIWPSNQRPVQSNTRYQETGTMVGMIQWVKEMRDWI